MNPRKLIDSHEPEKILKLGVDYHVHHRHTHFHFPDDQGSLDKALQRCMGIGACRKKDAGTMCPSYQWEDVDWQKHLITVRHEVAKQTSRKMGNRRFIPMETALLHWLGPYRKKDGLLVPLVDSAVRRRMKKLCLHSKVNPPNNALRHSYASYWLARSSKEGLGELSKRMGNSEAVCKRHYLETLTREEGKSWFALRRSSGAP
jgi:hypothetical protein